MTRFPTRFPALATAMIVALAAPATAQGVFVTPNITDAPREEVPYRGGLRTLHNELRSYGYGDVDVRRLSSSQIGTIRHIMYSGRSDGEIRNRIGTILRGGLGQRILDGVTR